MIYPAGVNKLPMPTNTIIQNQPLRHAITINEDRGALLARHLAPAQWAPSFEISANVHRGESESRGHGLELEAPFGPEEAYDLNAV
jgi:hypothetical protein